MDAVLRRLAEDSIGAGDVSKEFSALLARNVGRRSGVSFRTYGAAARASFQSLGLPQGARVGLSALAAGSLWRILDSLGHTPIPIDTQRNLPLLPSPLDFDYEPLELDALYVDARLGYVPPLEQLRELKIPIVEDASEGFGGNTGISRVGSVGEPAIIGLEPENILTAGGGAAVVTNNTRRVSQFSSAVDRLTGEAPLPDMNAALGITQLMQLEQFVERRKDFSSRFLRTLQRGNHAVPLPSDDSEPVFPALPVRVGSSPRDVEQFARAKGVSVSRAFTDTVLSIVTSGETEVNPDRRFPNALGLAGRLVLFPLYPALSKSELEALERVLVTLP
jgi:dTDP-4-amino-4,6-dideoxygalactose transaminase